MQIEYDHLKKWACNINQITISSKLRSFQYRFLMLGLITNRQLHLYKLRSTDLCTFCDCYPESLTHLFWECQLVKPLWEYVSELIGKTITTAQMFFVNVNDNPKRVENAIVLITKQFIYKHRCMQNKLSNERLKISIIDYENIELEIAKRKQKVGTHEIKWLNIKKW